MMNFMGSTGSQHGLYDDDGMNAKGKLPFSYSSSSSSSSSWHNKGHVNPLSYRQENRTGNWLLNNPDDNTTTLFRGCNEGGIVSSQSQLDLMMDSSPRDNSTTGGDDDDITPAAATTATGITDACDQNDDEHLYHMVRSERDSIYALGGTGARGSDTSVVVIEREHMFDKVVTPSDVGKLNRLVIPKQHAERYFPLDSSTNEKGLLLNFEDRNGKAWRFRYSYWNSSQSYVMTKGWSRFVKEKKLDAGDVVSFQRGVGDLYRDRLFIDWRRRPEATELTQQPHPFAHHFPYHRSFHQWSPLFLQPQGAVSLSPLSGPGREQALTLHQNSTGHPSLLPSNNHGNTANIGNNVYGYNYNTTSVLNPGTGSVIYLRSAAAAAAPQKVEMVQVQRRGSGVIEPVVFDSVPVVHGKVAAKRLRLFGVNMDCPIPKSDECDVLSSSISKPHSSMPATQLSSASSIPSSLQLRPYNGTPIQALPTDFLNKGKSSMSLDLDI